jgi:hypothetical protein
LGAAACPLVRSDFAERISARGGSGIRQYIAVAGPGNPAQDDDMDEKLQAKIQEAVDQVNKIIRRDHLTVEEAIRYLRDYLALHAAEEVLEFQEREQRRRWH